VQNVEFLRKILNPVHWGTKEGCMAGTCQDILARVFDWVEDINQPNILWLGGMYTPYGDHGGGKGRKSGVPKAVSEIWVR
jgi:hypothetical protein